MRRDGATFDVLSEFQVDMRTPAPNTCEEPPEIVRRVRGQRRHRCRDVEHVDAGCSQPLDPASCDRVRIAVQHVHLGDSCRDQRVGAGRRPTLMRARLERDDRGGAARVRSGGLQRDDLRVRTAHPTRRTFRDDVPVADDHASDGWVRT